MATTRLSPNLKEFRRLLVRAWVSCNVRSCRRDSYPVRLLLSSSGYEALLQKATEYHILLDFHGANKPTGRLRTWPNELVREAIRGIESSALRERARHETILAFTRYLAGPADYTAMLFNVYNGPYGRIQGGLQYSYLPKNTWSGNNAGKVVGGQAPNASMLFTSFR